MRSVAVVVTIAGLALGRAGAAPRDGTQAAIATLTQVAGCKQKAPKHKAWCLASGWNKGTAAALPKKSLVGIAISTGGEGKMIVDFAGLVVEKGNVSAQVWTGEDSDGHSKADAIAAITAVLEGKAKVAKIGGEAAEHVSAIETYAPHKQGAEWTWQTPQPKPFMAEHLRKVGKFWIDVSTDVKNQPNADGSIMVLVLTDAWE